MKRAYRVLHRNDSQGLAAFPAQEAGGLLPLVELIQRTEMAVDELIDAAGRSAIEAVLTLSARQIAGAKRSRTKQAAEDLVQEAFLRFWKDSHNFRRESLLKTYLLGIAMRVHSENTFRPEPHPKIVAKPNGCGLCPRCLLSEPESALCRQETKARLFERIDELLPRERQAVLTKLNLGECSTGIGKLALCTPKAQRKRLSRAYLALATTLT